MLFGSVRDIDRVFLYKLEGTQNASRDDVMEAIVTDFRGQSWKSRFTGKQIMDSFCLDVEPTWDLLKTTIVNAIRDSQFELNSSTGVLHHTFEIVPDVTGTIRIPPRESLMVACSDDAAVDADLALSLFHAWKEAALPAQPGAQGSPIRTGEKRSISEEAIQETPVKQRRSVGEPKIIQSVSKSLKKKQRNKSLRNT